MKYRFGGAQVALSIAFSTALVVACAPANLAPKPVVLSGAGPAPAAPEATFGSLKVTVRWPARTAQAIPDSTARVDIGVKDAIGTLIAFASVTRNQGETSVSKLVKVRAGSNYSIDVKAYASGANSGILVAQGSSSGISITGGQTTNIPAISLTPAFSPTVSGVDQATAVQGGSLVVTGTNFQPNYLGSAKPTIAFAKVGGGTTTVPADDVEVDSPTQVTVIVPSDATTGNLTVTHDGIASTGLNATVVAPGSAIVSSILAGDGTRAVLDGTGAGAQFASPLGIAVDGSGNVLVGDSEFGAQNLVRQITPAGVVSTLGGGADGDVDGALADTARFKSVLGFAFDGQGNTYVADGDANKVKKIVGGVVSTLAGSTNGYADGTGGAAQFRYPASLAVDSSNNVFVADSDNHKIRKITPAGVVTTFAGSTGGYADATGTSAQFQNPRGIAIDSSDNLYVADYLNDRIRKITPAGVVTTLAGSTRSFADGTGAAAQFNLPRAIAVDGSGNAYVADMSNHRIRKVTPAGVVTTVAGAGVNDTYLSFPFGVAVDRSGTVYVADTNNRQVKKFSALPATGTFKVAANSSTGKAYRVSNTTDLECRFQVLGGQTWTHISGTTYSAGGRPNYFANSSFTLNSGNHGALIVKRGDNTYEGVGADRTFVPASGEVLYFLMNDIPGSYADNTGSMTVSYSCGKVDAGNLNLTIQ